MLTNIDNAIQLNKNVEIINIINNYFPEVFASYNSSYVDFNYSSPEEINKKAINLFNSSFSLNYKLGYDVWNKLTSGIIDDENGKLRSASYATALLFLSQVADSNHVVKNFSVKDLSQPCSCSERHCYNIISKLKDLGIIKCTKKGKKQDIKIITSTNNTYINTNIHAFKTISGFRRLNSLSMYAFKTFMYLIYSATKLYNKHNRNNKVNNSSLAVILSNATLDYRNIATSLGLKIKNYSYNFLSKRINSYLDEISDVLQIPDLYNVNENGTILVDLFRVYAGNNHMKHISLFDNIGEDQVTPFKYAFNTYLFENDLCDDLLPATNFKKANQIQSIVIEAIKHHLPIKKSIVITKKLINVFKGDLNNVREFITSTSLFDNIHNLMRNDSQYRELILS